MDNWLSEDQEFDRKTFLKGGLFKVLDSLFVQSAKALKPLTERPFIRPPGAQVESLFTALCTRCDACTTACPHEAIGVYRGKNIELHGTPILGDLRNAPCLLCLDMPCITSCPTDALQPLKEIHNINLGTAVIDRLECTAYKGSKCTICYDICPIKDRAIVLTEGLPMVIDENCTGCGICQHHCPEDPEAISVFA